MTFKITRRELIKSGAAASAALAGGAIVVGCGNDVTPAPIADFIVGALGVVSVELARFPDLDPPGRHVGAITLRLAWPGAKTGDQVAAILLVQWATGKFIATQSVCPHKGCPLGFSKSDVLIECPCHASQFAVDGRDSADFKKRWCAGDFVHGPAQSGLNLFKVTVASGFATVDVANVLQPGSETPCSKVNQPLPTTGNVVTLLFKDYPDLMTPGGQVYGKPQVTPAVNPILIVRLDATTVLAIDALCTHQGCAVEFVAANRDLECPCHGSTYALSGLVTNGPAQANLCPYSAKLRTDGTGIDITIVQMSC